MKANKLIFGAMIFSVVIFTSLISGCIGEGTPAPPPPAPGNESDINFCSSIVLPFSSPLILKIEGYDAISICKTGYCEKKNATCLPILGVYKFDEQNCGCITSADLGCRNQPTYTECVNHFVITPEGFAKRCEWVTGAEWVWNTPHCQDRYAKNYPGGVYYSYFSENNACGVTEFSYPDFSETSRADEILCTYDTDCLYYGTEGKDTCCLSDGTCY